jgi:transmembrane sensor
MDKELANIILRSVVTQLTPEEQARLDSYLQESEANRQQYRLLTDPAYMEAGLQKMVQFNSGREDSLERITSRIHRPVRRFPVYQAAAAVLLLIIAGGVLLWPKPHKTITPEIITYADVAPGHTGAILTLSDGKQLTLDSLNNGVIANQSGSSVALQQGQLSYHSNSNAATSYNTMSTSKGRQFMLVLPDGTKVWLNAASALTYPTAFTSNQRRVKLSGEAYFEVAPNAKQPFVVDVDHRGAVEVLGTSFNINAYTDEADVKTTLLSGSVRTGGVILSPGQQAAQKPGEAVVVHNDVNIAKVTAWKNGRFDFTDASLPEVMRQLERWYDIEVIYEKGIPDTYFYGKISKDLPLSGILKALEAAHVHFRIEDGRRLVVMP